MISIFAHDVVHVSGEMETFKRMELPTTNRGKVNKNKYFNENYFEKRKFVIIQLVKPSNVKFIV